MVKAIIYIYFKINIILAAYLRNPIFFLIKLLFFYYVKTTHKDRVNLKIKAKKAFSESSKLKFAKNIMLNYKYVPDNYFKDYINLDVRYFFYDSKSGRDCDDYSYVWKKWLKKHRKDMKHKIYVIYNIKFYKGHAFTISYHKNLKGKITMHDYDDIREFESMNLMLDYICNKYKYNRDTVLHYTYF